MGGRCCPVDKPGTGQTLDSVVSLSPSSRLPPPASRLARGPGQRQEREAPEPRHLRVVRLDGLPARGPALDGLHGRGVERLLAQRPLLVSGALGALGLPLTLLLVDVVHTQEQAVVHDLEALQHLRGRRSWGGASCPPTPTPRPTCVCVHSVPTARWEAPSASHWGPQRWAWGAASDWRPGCPGPGSGARFTGRHSCSRPRGAAQDVDTRAPAGGGGLLEAVGP